MKIKLVILCIFGYLSGNAQTDSTILKTPDELWGAGNNKFAYTVNCIQSYLVSPHTVTQFEKTLGRFQRNSNVSDTTKYVDSTYPVKIRTPYYNNSKGVYQEGDRIDLTYTQKFKITAISYILEEDEIRVEKFKRFLQQVAAAGYKNDIAYTRINNALGGNQRRSYFFHPKTKISIAIYFIDENHHSITFTKG